MAMTSKRDRRLAGKIALGSAVLAGVGIDRSVKAAAEWAKTPTERRTLRRGLGTAAQVYTTGDSAAHLPVGARPGPG